MKILIPLIENKDLNSKISIHFGTCSYFGIYDTENKKLDIIKNTLDHKNNAPPVKELLKYKIDSIFYLSIGQKAINFFKENNISLKTGKYNKLNQVIENINFLENIIKSCKD